ncbi:hypothetical protein FDZ71_07660 [bacterium]|nr:MAG: hypothetical protein FDZ71_07660 [bacterium]
MYRDRANVGVKAVREWIGSFSDELRLAMFLVGASSTSEMGRCPTLVTGQMRLWLSSRGIDIDAFARRKG